MSEKIYRIYSRDNELSDWKPLAKNREKDWTVCKTRKEAQHMMEDMAESFGFDMNDLKIFEEDSDS